MKKIYILVINDLRNVGYNCKGVEVFTKKEDATERMRELYIENCKELWIDAPYDVDTIEHQFTNDFAYIFGEYYYDIFEKEV